MADLQMMEEKWTIVFKLMDINKDGVVSVTDRDFCKTTFGGMCSGGNQVQQLSDLDLYWDNLVFPGESPDWSKEISESDFIKRFKDVFVNNKTKAVQRVTDAVKHLLAAADLDGSKLFTFDKFFKFHEAFNLAHEVVVRTTFNLIGPDNDDTCSFDQVREFYVELFIGEDKEKFEALKNAYRAVGML